MFPTLESEQIARLRKHGSLRQAQAGEELWQYGDREGRLFVIVSGSVEILRSTLNGEERVVLHGPGQFTGEMSTLRGARNLVRARMLEAGELIVIDHENLRNVVQTDSAISELFMRAFILRRMNLIQTQKQASDVILVGSHHSAGTLRVQQFLERNGMPYAWLDVETDPSAEALLTRFHVAADEIPIVICQGKAALKNPSNAEIAACLGMNPQYSETQIRDVLVIGAGPAGLAAAVYAASEGLDVLVLENTAAGGQAGSSSKIENYLGFPTGISGRALAARALDQAQKFGVDVEIGNSAARLRCDRRPFEIDLSNGHTVRGRSIVIASGAQYRQLALPNLEKFTGVGVYYAATYVEAALCKDAEIIIVGGANSAGQAAVYLSNSCRIVNVLIRGPDLSDSMSRYLIRRIEDSPKIVLHRRTELTALEGVGHLEHVRWHDATTGQDTARDIRHVFLMTGAVPNTKWLEGCVPLDERGFVRTGIDLRPEDLESARWSRARAPYLMETGVPGVFAVGDVRAGSVKRVASAVGEGSISIQLLHRVLTE
jgi:thioredoxin reductase (NADPH)